ncbi:MAG: carboxypeptidase-like regulatory domain-containing protein [Bacteroidota bacterium]|nr:carboxypeptidase-like regulatory domain-containing protein [Bacteroidota bacterium]
MKKIILISISFALFFSAFSQDRKKNGLIQFTGIILKADSDIPIPYASISIKNTYRGTASNYEGFFSIAIEKDDTIVFSSMGFKKKIIILPSNIDKGKFNTIIELLPDTLTFSETAIYPWPSPANFKKVFLALEVNKDLYDLANENLSKEKMMYLMVNMKMDGAENQNLFLNQMAVNAGYYGGQTNYAQFPGMNNPIPLSLLNPFAWAKFIKALKEGDFKDKYKEIRE